VVGCYGVGMLVSPFSVCSFVPCSLSLELSDSKVEEEEDEEEGGGQDHRGDQERKR
jgi:hypothetical protein